MTDLPTAPRHRCIVIPLLKSIGQRFIMPEWKALTIGPLIFSWAPLDPVDLAHELEHVRQWRTHGLAFIPRYFAASRAAERAGGHRYFDNVFEVEARNVEAVVRARLGEHS